MRVQRASTELRRQRRLQVAVRSTGPVGWLKNKTITVDKITDKSRSNDLTRRNERMFRQLRAAAGEKLGPCMSALGCRASGENARCATGPVIYATSSTGQTGGDIRDGRSATATPATIDTQSAGKGS